MLLKILFLLFVFPLHALSVQDDARLLTQKTREDIEVLAANLAIKTRTEFLFRLEEKENIENFETDSRAEFSKWIRNVYQARGIMIYLQIEKNSQRGRINFSSGVGLQGAIERDSVRRILREKILAFRQDLSQQEPLVEGIREFFQLIEQFFTQNPSLVQLPPITTDMTNPDVSFLSQHRDKILIFAFILLASFVITVVLFVYSRRKCPRCGSRLHINVRPLAHGDVKYKRIKIVKCLDCNYFRKYLF